MQTRYGYVALGDPSRAASLAWRDARVSHVQNGIYASMWVAAMLAAAPAVENTKKLILTGLAEVPANSRLADAVETVLEWYDADVSYEAALDRLHDRWDQTFYHDWCHAVSNAQVVCLGLLWGNSRFGQSVCRTVRAGFDTDSNGATVGSLVGMLVGKGAISDQWLDPLDDTLKTGIDGHHRTAISDLVDTTIELIDN